MSQSKCRACGLPETADNPFMDYEHAQDCMIYMASGTCTCDRPGYVAHTYRCPVEVEGDKAPKRDAHLYVWITNPVLTEQRLWGGPNICAVVRAWGFEPKTLLTWIKGENGGGMGFFFRGDTEHVLCCVRGRLPITAQLRESNVFRGRRGVHSAKPDSFYDLVERVSPGPYAELFSRRARFGWSYPIGDQALGGVAA